MSLVRIAPLIRFLPKAHPFGSPIYVTASQHVPFASTAWHSERNFRDRRPKHGFRTQQNKLNRRRIRLRVCYGATGGRVLRPYGKQQRQRQRQEARKTPEKDGAPRARQEKEGGEITPLRLQLLSAHLCHGFPARSIKTRSLPTLAHCFPRSFSFCGDRGVIR